MKCPNCSRQMLCLFTSYVCERCNPSNAVKSTGPTRHTEAWVMFPVWNKPEAGYTNLVLWESKDAIDRNLRRYNLDPSNYQIIKAIIDEYDPHVYSLSLQTSGKDGKKLKTTSSTFAAFMEAMPNGTYRVRVQER